MHHNDNNKNGMETAGGTVELRVAEARTKDVGRGIARIDPAELGRLGLSIGDPVEILGERRTVCKAMPSFREDRGGTRVQLDALARENAGIGLDESARVSAVPVSDAAEVVLVPLGSAPSREDLDYIAGISDGLIVSDGDRVRVPLFGSGFAEFRVESAAPSSPAQISGSTVLRLTNKGVDASEATPVLGYEDIGGLGPQIGRIREMIELPMRFPAVFERLGIRPPKGVLLHGPPGTGKTLIARTIAHETEAAFYTVSGPEIVHRFYGESEKHLRRIWDEASSNAPAIIFLDEIDAIAPKRESTEGEVEKRIVAQLLALMDGLEPKAGVMVIAATNIPDNIDPALRRPGRFDREIEIPIPDRQARRQILEIHSRGMPLADDVDLDHLAEITHGYVGADLEALCREAAMACLRVVIADMDFAAPSLPYEQIQRLQITAEHFVQAYTEITPSAVREVFVDVPRVRWSDVGGLESIKHRLIEAVEWPLRHGGLFEAAGVRAPKGILLDGPPGVGKTLLAKALATETNANFISVKGPELLSKFVGDSEHGLRDVFRKARQASPCIIFFDEIDALIPKRGASMGGEGVAERMLSQFLAEMDGVEELRGVLVLGATNRVDMLDPAVLRPGRFDEVIRMGLPDAASRRAILDVHLRDRPMSQAISLDALTDKTDGLSGAELTGLCDRAAMASVRRAIRELDGRDGADAGDPVITTADIESAYDEVRAR